MREIEDRLVTLGVPYRVIGGPAPRARGNPRCAGLSARRQPARGRSRLRADRKYAEAGLGDATIQVLHNHARAARVPLMEAARFIVETDELEARAAPCAIYSSPSAAGRSYPRP